MKLPYRRLSGEFRVGRSAIEAASSAPVFCAVPPHPDLVKRFREEQAHAFARSNLFVPWTTTRPRGQGDGVNYPPGYSAPRELGFGPGAPALGLRPVKILVVLVNFKGESIARPPAHFQDLFFSTGRKIPTGSVREYYEEVSRGKVLLQGDVIGPFSLPQSASYYANGSAGRGTTEPNTQTLAHDTLDAIGKRPYKPYDNDGDGFVDAFVIVHAGKGAERTGSASDIWSVKWVLNTAPYVGSDGGQVYGFLTVPEDSTIGVCAHELGHLLFKLPDLYDISGRSSGIGSWCLMAGGAWNGTDGDTPAHLCAWAKSQLNWVPIQSVKSPTAVTFEPVEKVGSIGRLDVAGSEYFLIENRARQGFDSRLPGSGLLIWHVDDSRQSNEWPNFKVMLVQADDKAQLESGANWGDAGDPYPGTTANKTWDRSSKPAVSTYASGSPTLSATDIAEAGAKVSATCAP